MRCKIHLVMCFLFYCFTICICSCKRRKDKSLTPKEFINYTVVNRSDYVKDSMRLSSQLKVDLINSKDFFNNSSYYDSTEIIVDTVIYYADLEKMAAFIIIKNPTFRQLHPDEKHDWYYDGTCYLGKRIGDSLRLSWMGPSFSNSTNKEELSEIIRNYYFTEFATYDTITLHACKYNLNDIRFKECRFWKIID